jgi:hypothetical protein
MVDRAFSSYQMLTLLQEIAYTPEMQTVNQEGKFIRINVPQ